jgi:glycosyltransferase involved in cell wall biosynthesis
VFAMQSYPISCIMIAQDEAERIGTAIRSVAGWVDEVIVVDSGSTDGTDALARELGARVVHQPWLGFGAQTRFAEELCRNDWVLKLDADEEVTAELQSEIKGLFRDRGAPEKLGYFVDSHDIYPGRSKPRLWARDHHHIRFYNRRAMRFSDHHVHDSVAPGDHPIGQLSSPFHHRSFMSLGELAAASNRRASYHAEHAAPKPMWQLYLRLLTEMPGAFCRFYFSRCHFTGGWTGLRVAAILAYYRWLRIVRIIGRQSRLPHGLRQTRSRHWRPTG